MTMTNEPVDAPEAAEGSPRKPKRHAAWVDQWLVAKGDPLRSLVTEVREEVRAHQKASEVYKRRLRAEYARAADAILETMVVNLARLAMDGAVGDRLALHRNNGKRGKSVQNDRLVFGDQWEKLQPSLIAIGVLDYRRGLQSATRGEAPSVAPTEEFAERVHLAGVTPDDIGRDDREPVVILSTTLMSRDDDKEQRRKVRLDFADTAETIRLKAEMATLNAFLAKADISFADDGEWPVVDAAQRRLRRHFVLREGQEVRFDQGGRLFGGFWLNLKKHRRQHVRIDGEPVAILDFSAMATRLAYASICKEPPSGDPYAIPGLTAYRNDLKTLMNCLWFDAWERKRWPKEMKEDAERPEAARIGEVGSIVRKRRKLGQTLAAIREHHPLIADLFGTRIGDGLMFQESQILLASLRRLMADGVVGLGLHDGMMVAASKAELAKTIMEAAAKQVAGTDIPVRIE